VYTENTRSRTITAAGYPRFASIWKMRYVPVPSYRLNKFGAKFR
jgi:hypothetical protein